ncbi:kelch repeat-containing protein [Clostridium sp. KNHs205]|uniref:Kelch repeat-containing protein n=1 Tax=Clostridium sp. KNHs205 TaxID=1449050 RepID=UPI00051AF972|nr:kelch repeat-containing protein [Clostridium sp. KNHs205]
MKRKIMVILLLVVVFLFLASKNPKITASIAANSSEAYNDATSVVHMDKKISDENLTKMNNNTKVNTDNSIVATMSIGVSGGNITEWNTLTKFPFTSDEYNASATMQGLIYVVNGTELYQYNPNTNIWTKKASLVQSKSPVALAVVNDRLYALGGLTKDEVVAIEEYNPVTDTWIYKTGFYLSVKYDFCIEVIDGLIYIIGGNEGVPVDVMDVYNPVSNKFEGRKSMLTTRADKFGSAVLNGKIYVAGGKDDNTMEMYDPLTGEWENVASMTAPRSYLDLIAYNGKIYAIGGFDGIDALDSIEEYNPDTNSWRICSDILSTPQYLFNAFVLDEKILMIGGEIGREKFIHSFIIQSNDQSNEAMDITYEYDSKGRLICILNNGVIKAYLEYDKNGNLTRIRPAN